MLIQFVKLSLFCLLFGLSACSSLIESKGKRRFKVFSIHLSILLSLLLALQFFDVGIKEHYKSLAVMAIIGMAFFNAIQIHKLDSKQSSKG